jgi:hypothetical protein
LAEELKAFKADGAKVIPTKPQLSTYFFLQVSAILVYNWKYVACITHFGASYDCWDTSAVHEADATVYESFHLAFYDFCA